MGIFGWLKPEEEPEDKQLVEISDDRGNHIVIDAQSEDDALDMQGIARRDGGAVVDRDEALSRERRAEQEYNARDHDQLRVRSAPVEQPNEDREPETDDDSVTESNEQSATNGWWPF